MVEVTEPLKLYRIANGRFPIFDGGGAESFGGRWNSPGKRVIYCSGSVACCRLEILVNIEGFRVPQGLLCVEITVPSNTLFWEFNEASIDRYKMQYEDIFDVEWNHPLDYSFARFLGDFWYDANSTLIMKVPSVVSPEDGNYLINQNHPDFSRLSASEAWDVKWDERLFKRK